MASTTTYVFGAVAIAAAIAAMVALASGGGKKQAPDGGVILLGDAISQIWTLDDAPGVECGVPLVPRCTTNYGADVLDVSGTGPVWGWTPPGDLRAAQKYGKRMIADVEDRGSTKAKPSAGWTGFEIDAAELGLMLEGIDLASSCGPA